MAQSRTKNAIKNASITTIMQIANIILGFISRTVFIVLLNSDYLGVDGLFTNILTVLSFAELGIGPAIVYNLYEPIANSNTESIKSLMHFYKKAYIIVGFTIILAGLCLIPFLDVLIKEPPNIKENIVVIYLFFLFNTGVSYFFSYKKSLITANQKDYIVQIYTRLFMFIQLVLQTIFLLITHEYIAYLIIMILSTIGLNICLSLKANKLYPFLKEKNILPLGKNSKKEIFKNIRALFIYKIGSVVLNGTDNIIISAFIGIGAVGIASNYLLLLKGAISVIGNIIHSVTATIGNLTVKGSKSQIKNVIQQLLMISVWMNGFLAIGFLLLANDLVYIWIGSEYVVDQVTLFSLVFSYFICGIQYSAYTFRTTQGLFVQSKWVPLFAAILNIILSIWWGCTFGMAGVFIATGVSRLLTTTIVDPWLVYKKNFNKRAWEYYFKYVLEVGAVVINFIIQYWIISFIPLEGWIGLIVKFFVLCITINIGFALIFGWTKDFRNIVKRILKR